MKYKRLSYWIIKVSIVIFWCMMLILFLYSGNLLHFFDHGKNINVLVWGQVLDKEFLSDFEHETGIRVNMNYFENNEELFVKLQSSQNHDYDLIMPSDWAAELLIEEGLIKKLDRQKIKVWDTIYPELCNHYFDPNNNYTIPFYWSLFGIGVDTRYYGGKMPAPTWGLVFDPLLMPQRISMVEDSRALVFTAAVYLFGSCTLLDNDKVNAIKKLLISQKSRVEIYTDSRVEYVLASGAVPIAVGLSGDFLKVMRRFDYIDFIIPQEGGFAIIDSFALTSTTKKDDLVYSFLRYLFNPDTVKKYVDKFDFFPAVKINHEYDDRCASFIEPTQELFQNINFFKNIVSKDILNDVLITLKS